MRLIRLVVTGAAAAMLVLSGCGISSSSGASASSGYVNGVDYTYVVGADLGNLNPYSTSVAQTRNFDAFLYGTLLNITADGKTQGALAEKWTGDSQTATFTLKDGLTCSDGSPLKASDVAAVFNWLGDRKNKASVTGLFIQAGSKAVGDDAARTVKVTSGKPDAFLVVNLGQLQIVCKSGLDDPKLLDEGKAGTGAYTISKVAPGDRFTATLRDDYRGGPDGWTPKTAGVPKSVTARVIVNETTAANLFLSGEVNRVDLSGADRKRVESAKPYVSATGVVTGLVYFNQLPGNPGTDPAVRRAAFTALDLDKIIRVLDPNAKRSQQLMSGVPSYLCQGNSVKDYLPGYNPDGARQLLDNDGWKVGPDGVRSKDGKKLEMTFYYWPSPAQQAAAAELMQSQLKEVGFKLDLRTIDGTSFTAIHKSGDWGMAQSGWGFNNPAQMVPFFSGTTWPAGGTNFTAVDNRDYQRLAAEAAKVPGTDGCGKWNEAEGALIKNLDVVPVGYVPLPSYGKGVTFDVGPYSIRMTK